MFCLYWDISQTWVCYSYSFKVLRKSSKEHVPLLMPSAWAVIPIVRFVITHRIAEVAMCHFLIVDRCGRRGLGLRQWIITYVVTPSSREETCSSSICIVGWFCIVGRFCIFCHCSGSWLLSADHITPIYISVQYYPWSNHLSNSHHIF